ncbi:uncharacterized protein LOC141617370 [Silene latifolia]|uniref:uncharacterized protein LOC141617370 n=1 Tax=Silene latifolia TaxID=37657 RepID=UPI003D77793F
MGYYNASIKLVLDKRDMGDVSQRRFRFEQVWVGEEGCEEAVISGDEKGGGDLVASIKACAKELQAWKKINREYSQEELYWRQQSRALWLRNGYCNTKFFPAKASDRRSKNFIGRYIDDKGVELVGEEAIAKVAYDYLWASGPDKMNELFFQTYWHVICPSVVNSILSILRGDTSPEILNNTNILLIPNRKAPDKMRDFRPISFCNVVYKLVSKVLANRLKNSWHIKGHISIKLDMAKGYDKVEWGFYRRVLTIMGFDEGFMSRVIEYVSTVTFSVLIKGVIPVLLETR